MSENKESVGSETVLSEEQLDQVAGGFLPAVVGVGVGVAVGVAAGVAVSSTLGSASETVADSIGEGKGKKR